MVRLFTFSRSNRNQERVTRNEKKETPDTPGPKLEVQARHRFKRNKEVLDKINISLLSKMEELRVLPDSHSNDQIGSFFFDELDHFNITESAPQFRGLYHEIIDRSQTLPLILLNKKMIVDNILSRYSDKYMQPICSRLLISLIRDCGEEIYHLFIQDIIPKIADTFDLTVLSTIEIGFKVYASALKFISKVLQKHLIEFVKVFAGCLLKKKNPHIRRFTAESVVFLFGRIRQKKELVETAKGVFGLTLKDMGIEGDDDVMVQLKEDFDANLLYMLLRGDQGSISMQGQDLISFIAGLMCREDFDFGFSKKAFNLLIDNEYKFFKARNENKNTRTVGDIVYLEDFLDRLYESDTENDNMTINLLSILTEIVLFGSGSRFSDKLTDLSERILARSSRSSLESALIFITKYICSKKRFHPYINQLANQRLSQSQISLFFLNLFNKHTFTRTCVHKGFTRSKPDDIILPILNESLIQNLTLFIVRCINTVLQSKGRDESISIFLIGTLLEGNIHQMKLNLDKGDVDSMSSIICNDDTEVTEENYILYKLGILKILKLSKNVQSDSNIFKSISLHIDRLSRCMDTTGRESPATMDIDLNRMYDREYIDSYRIRTNNYDINDRLDLQVQMMTDSIQLYLLYERVDEDGMKHIYVHIDRLMKLRDNYTSIISALLQYKRVSILMSRQRGAPVSDMVESTDDGSTLKFTLKPHIHDRTMMYLWSEIPDARICALKLLIDSKSEVYTQLHHLDSIDVNFYKERELYLLVDSISTDIFYSKYDKKYYPIFFNFLIGFSSHRISTLTSPIMDIVSQLVYENEEFFSTLISYIIQLSDHHRSDMICTEEDNNYIHKLMRGRCDYVEYSVRLYRLMDWLEGVVGYYGNRRNRDGDKIEGEIKDSFDMKIVYPEATRGDANVRAAKLRIVSRLYRMLELLFINEAQFTAIPSMRKFFEDDSGIKGNKVSSSKSAKGVSTDHVFDSAKENIKKEHELTDKRSERRFCLEKMKRYMKALKASTELNKLPEKADFTKYLLEVIKFPTEEIQVLSLQTLFKLKKENKIIRQYSAMMTTLTTRDSFKENLMTVSEKMSGLSIMEREELIPIINSILYRRLVDRTGLANYRHFVSIRDFIFDTVSTFTEKEMNTFMETISMNAGITIPLQDVTSLFDSVSVSRLISYLNIIESSINRVSFGEEYTLNLMKLFSQFVQISDNILESYKEYARLSNVSTVGDDDVSEVVGDIDDADGVNDTDAHGGVERVKESEEHTEKVHISDDDKINIQAYKQFKILKNLAFKRILQVLSIHIEYNFTNFNREFIPSIRKGIDNLKDKKISKPTMAFKLIGIWAECEVYKHYFFDYRYTIESIIGVLNNHSASAKIYQDVFDIFIKLAEYGLTEDNESQYTHLTRCNTYTDIDVPFVVRKSPIDGEDKKYSVLGEHMIKIYINQLIDGLAGLSLALDQKKLTGIRLTDVKNLTKKISDFALFISDYCNEGEATLKFYEVTKKAWSVELINKKTAKPYNRIETAHELTAIKKDIDAATNMLKILSNFAGKILKIDEIFNSFILPLVSRLEDLKLRSILEDIETNLSNNILFNQLGIRPEFIARISQLNRLARNISRPTLDYNKIVDYLLDMKDEYDSLSNNEKKLLLSHCTYWLTCGEMSTREKSLDLLDRYIRECDVYADEVYTFYNTIILDSISYFLQHHFTREHVMKYYILLLRCHVVKFTNIIHNELHGNRYRYEYTDLSSLLNEDVDKDFFHLIFNLKIPNRGLALKVMKKVMRKKQVEFSPPTIKKVISRVFDFYLYEYWRDAKSSSNAYSHQRMDAVRNMLNGVYEVYGEVVSMLPFNQLIKFIKDKIFILDGKSEDYKETTVKIVCSCLEHMKTDLPNVLDKFKSDQENLNQKTVESSIVNRLLDAYSDTRQVTDARMNFDLKVDVNQTDMDEEDIQPLEDIIPDDEDVEEKVISRLSRKQMRVLRLHILQPLKRQLLKKDEEDQNKFSVRSEVGLAILQIIKLLPINIFQTELIGTISKICSVLGDRDEERRKTARVSLTSMIKILGPFFFGFFVKELGFHLKRGYEVHIRNYVIFKLLDTLVNPIQGDSIKAGQIDYSVPIVAPLLIDEICGSLDEEKEVTEMKNKTIEFKKNKGVDCFKMIAQKIDMNGDALYQIMDSLKDTFLKGNNLSKVIILL